MQHGDYIGFVDSDDYISNNIYDALFSYEDVIKNSPDLIRFQLQSEKGDTIKERITDEKGYFDISQDKSVVFDLLINKCQVANVVCCLYKREVIGDTRFNTEIKFGEDYLFNFNIFCKANSIFIGDDIGYHYVLNESSATHQVEPAKVLRRFKNHFDVDFYVYSKVLELKKYNNFYESTLNTTVRAVTTLLKLISKGLSYEDYSNVIEEMVKTDYYKRYFAIPNNDQNQNILNNYTLPESRKQYYEKFKEM